jgi:uncharacterized protein YbaR (Trm112 family)
MESVVINPKLLEILRCPVCVQDKEGRLTLYKESWLNCTECGRKYPIIEDIPVMLIEQGDKWAGTEEEALPIPPPPMK